MEFQILLLPKDDYWEWVRACKEYVLAYGPNMTHDPHTAARYMAPAQVITFPLFPKGYDEHKDIERWFQQNYAGIRMDPIAASTPLELEEELSRRIMADDRYGQRKKSFYLLWPTDYTVITQAFGANPQIYGRWDMPGHEGLDFRALTNTNIYCSADGEVYRVHTNPKDHPYGLHIRVRHKNGYKTVYAHLRKYFVKTGQRVKAGEIIGKADSTGATAGAHLHVTFKRDGATKRGETNYPKDIIDPTPFMVWPKRMAKSLDRHGWTPGKCLVGAHGRIGGMMTASDLDQVTEGRLEALFVDLSESEENINHLRRINPSIFLASRLTMDFSDVSVDPATFVGRIDVDLARLYRLGLRYFELHTKPNLQGEGWGRSWKSGEGFGQFFLEVVRNLKARYPDIRIGFPGISTGDQISGWRAGSLQFLEEAEEAIAQSDWLGVNCHWADYFSMRSLEGGRSYETYLKRYTDKLLIITEFNNPTAGLGATSRGEQYLDYYRMLREEEAIGAAFALGISSTEGYEGLVWDDDKDIASRIGARSF
jgi:murein DD-endopeptidase MepM/ murein hydrolase activator NlpD